MRWPAREVALGAVVAGAMNLLPACGEEFARGVAAGGNANGGTANGGSNSGSGGGSNSGGAPSAGGKAGSTSGGVGGAVSNAGAGGSSGNSTGDGGDGGDFSMAHAGAGSVPCEVELLTNGGFDTLNAGWTQMPAPQRGLVLHQSSDILTDLEDQPVSPEYLLLLGGVDSDGSTVSQQIEVPGDALSLAVSFYLHIHTEENVAQVYDSATLNFSTGAADAVPVATYTNLNTNEEWEPFSFQLDATPYRGMAPTFVIAAQTDAGGNTHFMFDSFSITADVCED
jgi:hypothetical protein